MAHIKLSAQSREITGKKVSRLRREGIIPIVVYGGALSDALSLQVPDRELAQALREAGAARVIDLVVDDGRSYPVLARTVQRDSMRHNIMHADFLAVRLDRPIEADIPLLLVGEWPLADSGDAILSQVADSVRVAALPDSLPSEIEVDISVLTEIGQSLTAADLQLGGSVTLISDLETLIVSVTQPTRAEVEDEADADVDDVEVEEGAEPGDEPAQDYADE